MVELAEDGIYNTCFLINRQGQIAGHYRKMHLYSAMIEDKAFRNGTEMPVFETDFGRIALMTCYDIRFVEMSRDYAMCGVEALVVVSNWAKPKLNHWRVLLQGAAPSKIRSRCSPATASERLETAPISAIRWRLIPGESSSPRMKAKRKPFCVPRWIWAGLPRSAERFRCIWTASRPAIPTAF